MIDVQKVVSQVDAMRARNVVLEVRVERLLEALRLALPYVADAEGMGTYRDGQEEAIAAVEAAIREAGQ